MPRNEEDIARLKIEIRSLRAELEEFRLLKTGVYNANSALQYLRTQVADLELTVSRQAGEIMELQSGMSSILEQLEM